MFADHFPHEMLSRSDFMADAKDKAKDAIDEGANKARQATDMVADKAGEMASGVRDFARQAGDQIQSRYHDVEDRAREGIRKASGAISDNPLPSVAVAMGIGLGPGLLVGLTLGSRRT